MSNRPIVAVDTMILVWGVRKGGTEEENQRARWLFIALDKDEAQIIVPSVTVAEYLTLVEEDKRSGVAQQLADRFIIAPLDLHSSIVAASLFVEEKKRRQGARPNSRKVLRADSLIIATAFTHGATKFYSNDADCRKMAKRIMAAEDLPDQPSTLFD